MSTLRGHALVTGAARGIGAATVRALAQAGADVTLLGRDAQVLQQLAAQLPATVRHQVVLADVTDAAAMQAAVQTAQAALGPIHYLVNNAGQAVARAIDHTDARVWQQMLDVNLSGVFHGIQAALPGLRESARADDPSRVINIASTAGLQGYPQVSAYVAAKHGVIGLTRALALELAKQHLTVNAVCPGYTETDIAAGAVADLVQKKGKTPEQARALLAARNPQQRMIQPDEVAHTVVWLCQRASGGINGQAIALDGGELAG